MIRYTPEPLTNFAEPKEAQQLAAALNQVKALLGRNYPIIAAGQERFTSRHITSVNPSRNEEVIGNVSKADARLADEAVEAAHARFLTWSRVKPEIRADYLFKAAAILRRKKHVFSAWMMLEAGKTRAEADADTAEAIDFMEYYARQMLQLVQRGAEQLTQTPGERNDLIYLPLGVGIIIPPWNFPLAIVAGMTTAAIVAGNTVVLKPSSLTPVIAYQFMELLREAGVPDGIVQYVPGGGSEIGDVLVSHKLTRFISFTGSKEVGIHLHEISAKVQPGQLWLKRFVGEMGGKDAIVVGEDADPAAAAAGIVTSAFGYSGQKCSACSRVIVHHRLYDEVLERVRELTVQLKMGDAAEAATDVGPVIDRQAYLKIANYIRVGQQEGQLVAGGGCDDGTGYFIEPTIFAGVDPDARLMQEEIFGPVVAFTAVSSFEDALRIANHSEYGLTGSVYTNNRQHIEQAKAEFQAGNLYINRKCTGAIVGVHPFGGFNMSGTDSKAGGPDYLFLFTQPKLISERL
ncbi:L-glutamate gamma-semialdehyde dehydrogenase [Paenibacillus sp. y28]|uniref:L-glutamate gamma-semialdehyde dehydrogenase n=1 Tax=Paenibacillus sp. y28 TaxID=3129110 RepID=UPI00301A2EC8